jgi:outer membrane protein OmpA-like peptidoglycan-associated protein
MNRIIISAIVLAATFSFSVCSSVQKETANDADGAGLSESAMVDQANNKLEKISYKGFAYKSIKVPAQKFNKWAVMAGPVLKEILNDLPDDYIVVVKGHTDSIITWTPKGYLVSNQKLSEWRAKVVYNALRKQGFSSKKLQYKGVGDTEPLDGVSSRNARNRRVTFEVTKRN